MLDRFEAFAAGITACYRYLQKIKATEMTELGLKGTHVMCLHYLHRSPEPLTAAQLCKLCAEDKAAISRTLSDLEERGYLTSASGKKYRAALTLTASGAVIAGQMEDLIAEWVAVGGQGLSESQRTDFYQTLGHIAQNLKNHIQE